MESLTETRQEFLQEMINISFGRAAASLAERLNVFVNLDVPKAHEIDQQQICEVLRERVGSDADISVIQQAFSGDFNGEVLLVIAADLGKEAVRLMSEGTGFAPDLPVAELEAEILLEIGNILVGACMGQFTSLLKKSIRYEIPSIVLDKACVADLRRANPNDNRRALIVATEFRLGDKSLNGFLFILLSERWFDALYLAVDKFVEQLMSGEEV